MRNDEASKPQWVKLWAEKYYDELCIEDIKELYPTPEEELSFLTEVGKAFVSALAYYNSYCDGESYTTYQMDRDGRRLYKSLKRDIDQSYISYIKRVENGKKGGRPPKEDDN
jgi:hypothetical protein